MSPTIAPVAAPAGPADPSAAAASNADPVMQAQVRGSDAAVRFDPNPDPAGPLGRLSDAGMDALRGFESRAAEYRATAERLTGAAGPASPVEAAMAEFAPGPASLRVGDALPGPASPSQNVGDAVEAMRLSFDYAVETQLVVKTGAQVSNAANSLLRGQ